MTAILTILHGLKSAAKPAALALFILITTHAFSQSENQSIAPELVGKWCFINLTTTNDIITSSCVTLNNDGTYELSVDKTTLPQGGQFPALKDSDYGTWWVTGNKISYKSNTSGQGTFIFQKANHPRLEKTPMIIINGVAFAAGTAHDPW